jgi:hypothetical protein
MKKVIKKILFLFLIQANFTASSQDYTGIWQGYITGIGVPVNTNYTLHIKKQENGIVFGRAYIFSKKYLTHQGILDFVGEINGNNFKITELVIVNSITTLPRRLLCIKYASLRFAKRNNTDFLSGFWDGSTEENTPCVPGEVHLKKLTGANSESNDPVPGPVLDAIAQDKAVGMPFLDTELLKPVILDVSSRQVTLEIKDYLKEDNDTVSIYYNRKLLIERLRIGKQSFKQLLRLDRKPLNEIVLYANNLGAIPPNTSNLTIRDGSKTQRVIIESTKQSSAVIYLRYTPRDNSP